MAIGTTWLTAAFFGFVGLYAWWFHFTVGPAHGAGSEIGIVAGVIALLAAAMAVWLMSHDAVL